MRLFRFCLLPALILSLITAIHAQKDSSDAQSPNSVLKTTSRAVVVDVVVTKAANETVGGLSKQCPAPVPPSLAASTT